MGHLDETPLYRHCFTRGRTVVKPPSTAITWSVSRAWARHNTAHIARAMDVDAVSRGNTLNDGTLRAPHSASAFPGYGFTTLNSFAGLTNLPRTTGLPMFDVMAVVTL